MALTESIEYDKIEVVGQYKHVQVRKATVIKKDGTELSKSFQRKVIVPGTLTGIGLTGITITDVSGEDASVQAIAGAVFDATCLEAYRLNAVGVRSESNL